jgi:hypothetical protein
MGFKWLVAVAAVSVGLAAGCSPGGNDSNGGSGDAGLGAGGTSGGEGGVQTVQGSPIGSAESYRQQLGTAVCGELTACCSEFGIAVAAQACAALASSAGTAEGLIYDPDAAGDCLATVRTLDGCAVLEQPPVCSAVFVGTKTTGEACAEDDECAPVAGGLASCGFDEVCIAEVRGAAGDACASTCTEETQGAFAGTTCSGGGGQDADPSQPSVSCFTNDGLFCGSEGACAAVAQLNEDCAGGARCADGLDCRSNEADARVCQPYPMVGESCFGECADGYCLRGDDGSMCTAFVELGGACDPDSFEDVCGPTGACGESSVCEAASAENPAAFVCAFIGGGL